MFAAMLIALLASLAAAPPPLPAHHARWFELGHRLVAAIAESRLTPAAAGAARDLLGGQSLQDASVWADQIREQRRGTAPLHFVNIPLTAAAYDPARDCPGGRCIIAACDSFARVVADPTRPRAERTEALRFLAHLIGDLHQPLHVADNADKGGNELQVRVGGDGSNLHQAWDGRLMEQLGIGQAEYLGRLRARMAALDLDRLAQGTTVDWAMEGHATARRLAYRVRPGQQLEGPYVAEGLEAIDQALIRAGVRLAAVLNQALGGSPPGSRTERALPAGTYSDAEAIAHVGEVATVVGTVASVATSKAGNTFVNFGADYPRQTFSAVLLRPGHPGAARLAGLRGRRVSVRGLIRRFRGQAQIVIEDPGQVVPLPE